VACAENQEAAMKKLAIVMLVGMMALWATMAFAQDYAALGGDDSYGPYLGLGGLYIMGDDNANPANSTSEFLPTVNLTGLNDMLAWQVFYGFGAESTVWGGNVDYILANNFDKCFTCPDMGKWWFGIGPTFMDVSDLYYDSGNTSAALSDTMIGANLGFGYLYGNWHLNLYAHYMDGQMAFQGMVMYNLMPKKK
jgi:hypothetical protein